MSSDLEDWYSSLNELLKDICSFLSDECKNEKLSANAKKKANVLIMRSKVQLQDMAVLIPQVAEPDAAYVDMQRRESTNEPVKEPEPPKNEPITKCPYLGLPARELKKETKRGYLLWKTKFLLHFEKMRNVFAGIHGDWFLIYTSNRDLKPVQTLDLRFCEVVSSSKDKKNEDKLFEIINTLGKRKSFMFIAQTHKDMLQWVERINNYNNSVHSRVSECEEAYDVITPTEESNEIQKLHNDIVDDDVDEAIYDDIITLTSYQNQEQDRKSAPPLPPNRKPPIINPLRISVEPEVELSSFKGKINTQNLVKIGAELDTKLTLRNGKINIPNPVNISAKANEKQEYGLEPEVEYDPVLEPAYSESTLDDSFSEDEDEENIYETFIDQRYPITKANGNVNTNSVPEKARNNQRTVTENRKEASFVCEQSEDEEELYCELVQP